MKPYRIIYMDAFTSVPFSGNPCAVLPEADGLTDRQMQQIAMETNLSETAFVLRSDKAAVRVRYFMPHKEIPFAGHPTIATAMMLVQEGMIPVQPSQAVIDFEFNIGILPVEIFFGADGKPLKAIMTQQKPSFTHVVEAEGVTGCMGIVKEDLIDGAPVQVVSTGVPFLMVPVNGMAVLKKVRMDYSRFQSLTKRIGVDAAYMFCLEGIEKDADAHGRLLSSTPGLEDPFTGSAVGCMGAYVVQYGLLPRQEFTVEQGHLIGRPGKGTITVGGSAGDIQSVTVGGCAVKTLDGVIYAPN
jgi:trans-2,3-dihydro-3-hydroxyanthranilate isomerase